jgi:hypothetical protein
MRMPLSPNDFPPEAEKCGHENCQQPGVTWQRHGLHPD